MFVGKTDHAMGYIALKGGVLAGASVAEPLKVAEPVHEPEPLLACIDIGMIVTRYLSAA